MDKNRILQQKSKQKYVYITGLKWIKFKCENNKI